LFLVGEPVADFDMLRVHLSVTTDFTDIQGFTFVWRYRNQDAGKYLTTSNLLVVFVARLRFEGESFTQCLLMIIGITG
jgi:hypothetical protein